MIWGSETFQCLQVRDDFSFFFPCFEVAGKNFLGAERCFTHGQHPRDVSSSSCHLSLPNPFMQLFQVHLPQNFFPWGFLRRQKSVMLFPAAFNPLKALHWSQGFLNSLTRKCFLISSRICNSGCCLSCLLPSKHWELPAAFYLLHIWRLSSCFFSVLFSLDQNNQTQFVDICLQGQLF